MNDRLAELMECDVCVIGAGPAGSSFARRMAQLGYQVVMVEKLAFPRPHIGESLPPGILPLLDQLEMRAAIEKAGFLRPREAHVLWPGRETQHQEGRNRDRGERESGDREAGEPLSTADGADAPGFQVERGHFDDLLLRGACQAGVRLLQPAYPLLPLLPVEQDQDPRQLVEVALQDSATRVRLRCRFIADASGRRGVLGGIKERSAPRTLALYAYWRDVPGEGDETRVEARSDCWYWGAPLPGGTFNACVFLDPGHLAELPEDLETAAGGGEHPALSNRDVLQEIYETLLERSHLLHACLQGVPQTAVEACDATSTADLDPVNFCWIKLGEAALSIDPLSSQGVQAAIRSGLQGAATVHTILSRPRDARWARRFYRDRCREAVEFHQQLTARYARLCLHRWNTSFWRERARSLPSAFNGSPSWEDLGPSLPSADSADVLALLEPLRRRPDLGVKLHADSEIAPAPVLVEDFIRPFPALYHPRFDRPVAFLQGIPVQRLLEPLDQPCRASSLLESWNLPPRRALRLLAWLLQHRVLVFKRIPPSE
ncbi:MAG TPA: FAD-dependent monooxygenase [Acidobacteriota bacterium]|nr:FAD-dependent monooxygenase [Acidobacteriota bacterium]